MYINKTCVFGNRVIFKPVNLHRIPYVHSVVYLYLSPYTVAGYRVLSIFTWISRTPTYLLVHAGKVPVILVRVLVVDLRHRNDLPVRVFYRHAQQRRRIVSHYAVHLVVESRVLKCNNDVRTRFLILFHMSEKN